jgi:hypothetical protein
MDLSAAFAAHLYQSGKRVVFSGSDYGKVIPSVTVPRTFENLIGDVNRYAQLYDNAVQTEEPLRQTQDSAPSDPDANAWHPLPRPFTIKRGLINTATFHWRHERKRNHRQRTGCMQENNTKHEQRTQAFRTKRAYAKVTAEERRYISEHVGA